MRQLAPKHLDKKNDIVLQSNGVAACWRISHGPDQIIVGDRGRPVGFVVPGPHRPGQEILAESGSHRPGKKFAPAVRPERSGLVSVFRKLFFTPSRNTLERL